MHTKLDQLVQLIENGILTIEQVREMLNNYPDLPDYHPAFKMETVEVDLP
jgi:hypothetical protein